MAPTWRERFGKDEATDAAEGTRNLRRDLGRIGGECKDRRIRRWGGDRDPFPSLPELFAARRTPDSVVTDFDTAAR